MRRILLSFVLATHHLRDKVPTDEPAERSEGGSESSHDRELLLSELLVEGLVVVEGLGIVSRGRHFLLEKGENSGNTA